MNTQQMMEEIDRLARLCEAKDAEIERLEDIEQSQFHLNEQLIQKLSEAQAQIAMQADMFERIAALVLSNTSSKILTIIDSALSATSENVAAWRAKETEPLRREVAILRDAIRRVTEANYEQSRYAVTLICQEALAATQATALAYEREVKAKALEEAASKCQNGYDAALISKMAEAIRSNKE